MAMEWFSARTLSFFSSLETVSCSCTNCNLCSDSFTAVLSCPSPDTLLNVFLAIAVDNLANAEEMTKKQKREAEKLQRETAEKELQNQLEENAVKMQQNPVIMDEYGSQIDLYDLSGLEPPQVNICPPSPNEKGGLSVPSSK